ncbi:AraC family transcriptional regulator [Paenibacillus sp. MBLB4367]|uniref:AraC family transcriptional regulator n=1 Tax=Paenibacillus sp. MBLB4367 TaxID=3384767 RepID=UPI0039080645
MHTPQSIIEFFAYRMADRIVRFLHSHPEYELIYIHSGWCNYFVGVHSFTLTEGDLIIMNGLSLHGPMMKDSCLRTDIRFSEADVKPLTTLPDSVDVLKPFRDFQYYRWHLEQSQRQEIEQLLLNIRRFYYVGSPDLTSYNRLRAVFLELLLFVYDCSLTPMEEKGSVPVHKEIHVRKTVTYIEEHYMNDLTLDELAEGVHLSKFYLTRIFKELTGLTVFEYINKQRIKEAKLLFMSDRNPTVTEVCYKVGFNHPPNFSTAFKRLVGVTPEQFRKY